MNVTLVIAVIVVSGVVAYAGDVIGKRLGKKRVSVFGLRPRQTAVLIAVITGWVITFGTIAALALASSSVREAVFNLGQLHEQIREAEADTAHAQAQRDAARDALTETQNSLLEAESRATNAQTEAEDAEALVSQTQGELGRASGQVQDLRGRQGRLEGDVRQLTAEGDKARTTRDQALAEAGKVSFIGTLYLYGYGVVGSDIYVLQPGDELARTILPRHTDVADARRAVERLMEDGIAAAKAAGCVPYDYPDDGIDATTGLYLILRRAEPQSGAAWTQLTLPQREEAYDRHLRFVAEQAASRTEAGDRVYVTLNVWDYPVPSRKPAIVEFRMDRVEPVFRRGNILATELAPLGATKNQIADACHRLLRDARTVAIDRGVVWRRAGVRELPYEDLESVIREVLRLHEDLKLAARLSAVVSQEECLNIDEPEIRIEVDPAL